MTDERHDFVVETCNEGSDWCVRAATQAEIDDPDEETLPLDEALEFGKDTIARLGGSLYDFSGDPPPDAEPKPKRYLDFRFDVTGLSEDEVAGLWGEVAAQAERSERHPSVEYEGEIVEHPVEDEAV